MSASFDPRHYLADFVIEAGEHLADFDDLLAQAERSLLAGCLPEEGLVHRLFRAVHTLKGMAGMLGFSAIVTLTHETEGILASVRSHERRLDTATLALLMDVADGLARLLEQVNLTGHEDGVDVFPLQAALMASAKHGPKPEPVDLLDRLEAHLQMSVLVDVARGERLFNLTYAGNAGATWLRTVTELGRVLGAWDANGQSLTPETQGALQAPIELLLLTVPDARPEDLRERAGLPPGALVDAPLPWLEVQVPEALPASTLAPREAAEHAAGVGAAMAPGAVRVGTARLDRMSHLAEALSAQIQALDGLNARVAALEGALPLAQELTQALTALGSQAESLSQELLAARRVSAGTLFGRFLRPVRELARACGKSVRLEPLGSDVLLDKDASERLVEPLMHLLRNAIAHGIEAPAERQAAGKPAQGVIALSAAMEGDQLVLAVADDGQGIDRAAVLAKALEAGLLPMGAMPDVPEIERLIFHPGLSTAPTLSDVSGRGVGMDAVKASLESLGGRAEVTSQPGRGTRFVLRLPMAAA